MINEEKFKTQFLSNKIPFSRIYLFARDWYNSGRKVDIWDWLGMTEHEYAVLTLKGSEELIRRWRR